MRFCYSNYPPIGECLLENQTHKNEQQSEQVEKQFQYTAGVTDAISILFCL